MHGQWWSKFSRSLKGFEIYILNLQCTLIFLHFYPYLACQFYHISASISKIQAPMVWHHPWVLENALKSHVNISLIYPQKWWSMMGSRSLCVRVGGYINSKQPNTHMNAWSIIRRHLWCTASGRTLKDFCLTIHFYLLWLKLASNPWTDCLLSED